MVAIQTVDKALSTSESLDLTVSYTENLNVQTVKAFVLSFGTSAPPARGLVKASVWLNCAF